jgi:hypothetical protein
MRPGMTAVSDLKKLKQTLSCLQFALCTCNVHLCLCVQHPLIFYFKLVGVVFLTSSMNTDNDSFQGRDRDETPITFGNFSTRGPWRDGDLVLEAIHRNDLATTERLLLGGAKVENFMLDLPNCGPQCVLEFSHFKQCRLDALPMVKLLVKHKVSQVVLEFLFTGAARCSDQCEVLDFLLQAGVDINSRGVDTTTACHFAACRGDFKVDMLEFLLARGADPNVRDGLRGRTPCHRAVEYHRGSRIALHMIPLLLEHGGDFEITDDYGVTPIETAFYDIMFDVVLRLAALVPAAVARTRMPPFDRDDDFRRITAVQLAVGCPYDDLNQHHRHVRAHLSHQVDLYRASIVADRKWMFAMRAFFVGVALHQLDLPALVMLHVLDEVCFFFSDLVDISYKYAVVVMVKHFRPVPWWRSVHWWRATYQGFLRLDERRSAYGWHSVAMP